MQNILRISRLIAERLLKSGDSFGSLSNVGVNISWKKNREKTRRVAELPSLRLGSTMKDPVSESREFSDSEANTLENFYLVVATFCKAVGIMAVESIQY